MDDGQPASDPKPERRLRSYAWTETLKRLRAEFPAEYKGLLAGSRGHRNPTQHAGGKLRQRHPERAAELYRQEVVARGLPAPVPQPGRWPR